MWTPLESLFTTTKSSLLLRCQCGVEKRVRVADLLVASNSCRSCAMRKRMQGVDPDRRKAVATKASIAAAEALKNKPPTPLEQQFGAGIVEKIKSMGVGAKSRCNNPNELAYKNYGGRGIKFLFATLDEFAAWVLYNLGPRPGTEYSLDRIDNNRHYEPGNLRWATRTEQARNKRQYKRTEVGERIRYIQSIRKDLHYETIRMWIKKLNLSNEEILNRGKYARTGV
jgi:hypothetical protein